MWNALMRRDGRGTIVSGVIARLWALKVAGGCWTHRYRSSWFIAGFYSLFCLLVYVCVLQITDFAGKEHGLLLITRARAWGCG